MFENNDFTQSESYMLKRSDPQFIFSTITRAINLINDGDKQTKKTTITSLHKFICLDQPSIKPELIQEILISFNKNLIRYSLFEEIDKVRENSLKILIYLFANCTNIVKFFPFIFSALVDKLDCNDLEGFGNLPEDIRPTPSQNPHKVIKVNEQIEEIRILYIKLLETIISNESALKDDFRLFVQDIVNITRTLCMDPAPNVVLVSCNFTQKLAENFGQELLYYFNSILSRGLLYALSHKQAKLRLAALNAINKLMFCSPFKKNVEIMEQLIGFRDPTIVPIKDFYEPSTKFNYLAFLAQDQNFTVLHRFYEVISGWMIDCDDRVDHENRLIPYIITGLFDKNEEIASYVYERFEIIGKLYEKTNEKDYRDMKQYGVDEPWTEYINKDNINKLFYPFPLTGRPILGCRKIVANYLRRYIKNLTSEFEGIDTDIKLKVANLLLYSIVFAEEMIIEFLDGILMLFMKDFLKTSNSELENLLRNIQQNLFRKDNDREINIILIKAVKLMGRFCDYDSITRILYSTIKGDLNGNYQDIQRGALNTLKYAFIGHCDSSFDGLGMFKNKFKDFISVIGNEEKVKEFIDSKSSYDVLNFYFDVVKCIKDNIKKFSPENLNEFKNENNVIFNNILHALGSSEFLVNNNVYKFIEKNLNELNDNMKIILNDATYNFFNSHSLEILKQIDDYLDKNFISMQNKYYKILYLFIKCNKLFFEHITEDKNEEIRNEIINTIFEIYYKIFSNEENFTVHSNALQLIISFLSSLPTNYNYTQLSNYSKMLLSIIQPYSKIIGEEFKFKFADLLKDEKELEKKKRRNPKTLKTELRRTFLLYIKSLMNSNSLFKIDKANIENNKKNINTLLLIFNNSETLKNFYEEMENLRDLFGDTYKLFLTKYFVANNNSEDKLDSLKKICKNFEVYFKEEIYDNNIEIRKKSIEILNIILNQIPISQYFKPMKEMFDSRSEEAKNFQLEMLKAMAYIDDEKKLIEQYFNEFKDIMSAIINEALNEKMAFGNLCDKCIKLITERFPIYVFNEIAKAQKKEQIARVEYFNIQLKKIFK